MKMAIGNYLVKGVATTLPFGSFVMNHEAFLSGQFDTLFINKFYTPEDISSLQKQKAEMASMVALKYFLDRQKETRPVESVPTNWKSRLNDK